MRPRRIPGPSRVSARAFPGPSRVSVPGIIRRMNPQDAPPQQVLTLPGAVALSPFRLEKLLAALPPALAEGVALDARFVHFVALAAALGVEETQVLEKLLTYGTP